MSLAREAEITPDMRRMFRLINYFGKIRGAFGGKKMLKKVRTKPECL